MVFCNNIRDCMYCSKRYYVKQDQYTIIISDVFGKRIKTKEIRTEFKTHAIAHSFVLEYQNRFKEYKFSVTTELPEFK